MLLNDLRFALRTLKRNRLSAAINVLGLTIGISACLVIFLLARYELTFDQFHPDGDRIYRVYSKFTGVSGSVNRGVPTGISTAIHDNFTGIESMTRFHTYGATIDIPNAVGERKSFERHSQMIFANPDYFQVFNIYEWKSGNPEKALANPFSVVLTESRARTYFGELPADEYLGKEIHYDDSLAVNVTGVVADLKEHTDFEFTDIISYATTQSSWLKEEYEENSWNSTTSATQLFIKLTPQTSRTHIMDQMPRLMAVYKETNPEQTENWGNEPQIQPLADIHFNSELGVFDNTRAIPEKSTIEVLMLTAFVLLIIATINFVNLETAQASRRAKEVGVRKVLGSSRKGLIKHFLIDSFFLTFISVLLSIVVAYGAVIYFSDFLPPGLTIDFNDPIIPLFLICVLAGVTILAGLYPAFVLSSYKPALALKNMSSSNSSTSRSASIRKGLTVFQFGFAQLMIIATLAMGLQIKFMLNKDLGFDKEGIVYFFASWHEAPNKKEVLKNEMDQIEGISAVSMHQSPPSSNSSSSSVLEFDNGKEKVKHQVFFKGGDTTYFRLYNIRLLAGRNVTPIDSVKEYVINETYLKTLGFTDPNDILGRQVNGTTIVGVMNDFHTKSLHKKIEPLVFKYDSRYAYCIALKFPGQKISDVSSVMKKAEAAWKKVYPDENFNYKFLDESIEKFYENEKRTATLARTAMIIAILISCLGLFGLSSFTVIQRTKEIGIRKVLGASVNSILVLLSKDFLVLVVVSFVISAPLAWYGINQWLDSFAYRMELGAWIFALSGVFSVITAFVTISLRTVKAAKADPVQSLRYE
jgi:putative ABC transport system permease protein